MNTARVLYRTRQFWHALARHPNASDLERIGQVLNPAQQALFLRMHPNEQAHSLHVWQVLLEQNVRDPDLQVAALLHDVGKSRFPLLIWERVWIVLARVLFPGHAARWGRLDGRTAGRVVGWRKAFVVAENHPRWGAEMAATAGASPRTVSLIRRHQDKLPKAADNGFDNQDGEEHLLGILQSVDDNS